MGYPHTDNQRLRLEDVAGSWKLIQLLHKLYSDNPATAGPKRRANLTKVKPKKATTSLKYTEFNRAPGHF